MHQTSKKKIKLRRLLFSRLEEFICLLYWITKAFGSGIFHIRPTCAKILLRPCNVPLPKLLSCEGEARSRNKSPFRARMQGGKGSAINVLTFL